jgi:hypothetical protein
LQKFDNILTYEAPKFEEVNKENLNKNSVWNVK